MNIVINPTLDGVGAERFRSFALRLADATIDEAAIRAATVVEATWAGRTPLLNGQTASYEAAVRLLADLRMLKWTVRADACGIELESPRSARRRGATQDEIRAAKEDIRRELAPALASQFADPLVRQFILDLEEPPRLGRRKSIRTLITDGAEVFARLQDACEAKPADRPAAFARAIQPYLQLVPSEAETTVLDEVTGIPLGDIWRYFRYTWSIPQTAIPGRQMFYLIRDRAHAAQAVIGIAALSNSPLLSPPRDKDIGWHPDAYVARFRSAAMAGDRAELRRLVDNLVRLVSSALDEINPQGLARPEELSAPTEDLVARLQRRADEFASRREDALREAAAAADAGVPFALQETELDDYAVPPVSNDLLELEGKPAPKDSSETLARRLLVAKKRAFELARLCRARLNLAAHRDQVLNPATTGDALNDDDFCVAMNIALTAAKSDRVGTNILEITTCGAVPPYNHILGGKLVALLLLSPEVANDYRRRYGDRPAIISSQMKNTERTKDCTLAWLNTTSLYAVGSSQYERLRLPAGIIAPDQPELRYKYLGDTEGFGTVQFSDETIKALQAALAERQQFRNVNSIFGEGFSPKFRKLRDGMLALGFNASVLMRHDQPRRMYGVPMWNEARDFLRAEAGSQPSYIRSPQKFRDATERIADFWRRRWLASRLNYAPALEALRASAPWSLHNQLAGLPVKERSLKSRPRKAAETPTPQPSTAPVLAAATENDPLRFWCELAQAGPEACADELTPEQLARLHVEQPLDDFLLDHVRRGFSLVLTGNAGDGKTHLLRKLSLELEKLSAEVETDATAAMEPNDVSAILRRWKKAHRQGRPFCLAANEYPLYLLRHSGKGFAPLDEVERQCEHRLAYDIETDPKEAAREKVLVLDLSLRNPLALGFARPMLDALLRQSDIQAAAQADPDGDLAWNLRHLSNQTVRDRLLELFARLAAAGHRATVRELWVWAARMLFGSGQEDRKPVRSPERWFSSRLFECDDRFALSKLLRDFADPASHSHPRWDCRLETGQVSVGWLVDDSPYRYLGGMDNPNFRALKRFFYFDHQAGEDVLKLDGRLGADLLNILRAASPPENAFKRQLIETINLAYCPVPFPEMKTLFFLWIGYRFHEQPSHAHLANQSVSEYELKLRRPRLPSRLAGAFYYQADHLLLEWQRPGQSPVCLRVDHPLFVALERLRLGLPRQLLPDRELNRLDYFIEQLRRANVPTSREFYIHNHDERTTARVALSGDFSIYESVQSP